MCELKVVDGFVEINENLGDMIKYVVNEPSVGLYYIQQHAQNAIPNVVKLKNNIISKSNEVSLHTEDLEDSIDMTRTMKQSGFPIIDEMIQDIKMTLTAISAKKPSRGLIAQRGSGSWGAGSDGYFSSVIKTAKERAVNLRWPQLNPEEVRETTESVMPNDSSTHPDDGEELPLSSQVENEIIEESNIPKDEKTQQPLSKEIDFNELRAAKETLLEEWLTSSGSVL